MYSTFSSISLSESPSVVISANRQRINGATFLLCYLYWSADRTNELKFFSRSNFRDAYVEERDDWPNIYIIMIHTMLTNLSEIPLYIY